MNKPTALIMNYIYFIQIGVLTVDDVPNHLKAEVEKWNKALTTGVVGGSDNGMANQ